MLAAEQSGRYHNCGLAAGHDSCESRPQGDFGLAEPDIAANQAIHGIPRFQIFQCVLDRVQLVVGLGIRKARGKFLVKLIRHSDFRRRSKRSFGRHLDQLIGNIPQPLLHPRFAGLPRRTSKTIERRRHIAGPVS